MERVAGKPRPAAKPGAFKRELARAMEGPQGPAGPRPASPRPIRLPQAAPAEAGSPFRQTIARLESGGAGPGQGHAARNPASGALGRYQMLPVALRDIGWQDAAGGWTALAARHGVASEADFLASPAAQEAAMDAFLRRAEAQLERNGSLARAGGTVRGLDGEAVPLTEAGLVAAAHRRGAGSVARYLAHRTETPDAPLSPAQRSAFAAVERRLRDFAAMPYALASRRAQGAAG
ncbi:hypothetical protein [Crenalkalicoccus roseus]|uniref:hypothetical protein n=1 Tax=Crenalkalicoccus roseus TaxID=1485588 RepID=UPI0010815228|nr:hypothetical protein [Crenalkalicoccus roseus]